MLVEEFNEVLLMPLLHRLNLILELLVACLLVIYLLLLGEFKGINLCLVLQLLLFKLS